MKRKIFGVLIIVVFMILILNMDILLYSTKMSIDVFINKIFIYMFPFIIISNIFINIGIYNSKITSKVFSKLFNISNDSYLIILLSMISGYPSSATYIKEYLDNKKINVKEATYLLSISSFPNPMFVIGTVGISILNNKLYGIILLLICYLSNFIYALIIKNKYNDNTYNNLSISLNNESISVIIKKSIMSSINTMILILGNITIFILILNLITSIINIDFIKVIISILLEMTSSIITIDSVVSNDILKIGLISFTLSFSGFSILSQISSIISNYNINKKEVIINKLLISMLSFLISIIYFTIIRCF